MYDFINQTLQPTIFWNALAALGTLSAVLVALFLPVYNEYKKNNIIETLIDHEIDENQEIITRISGENKLTLPNGETLNPNQIRLQLLGNLKLTLWDEYKFKLSSDRPASYKKYESINSLVESMLKIRAAPSMEKFEILNHEVKSFLEKHKAIRS